MLWLKSTAFVFYKSMDLTKGNLLYTKLLLRQSRDCYLTILSKDL